MTAHQPSGGSPPGVDGQPTPQPPEIPEFRDVEQLPDGSWRAIHKPSGETITAADFYRLERIEAPVVRISYSLKRTP
jgi:hypothetical protein